MTNIQDFLSIKDRVVMITGATGHLGKRIAEDFAILGAGLLLVDQNHELLEEFANHLKLKYSTGVEYHVCNLEYEPERAKLIQEVAKLDTGVNVLINNAAFVGTSELSGWNEPFLQQSIETWRRALEVNVTAAFHLIQGLTPILLRDETSSIINIASIYGVYAPNWSVYEGTEMNNPAAYAVSKAGIIQLTKWLASLLGPQIRVNSISPGGISRNQPSIFIDNYSRNTSLKRMAQEDDISGSAVFLASRAAKYITGQNLIVDGGWGK